MYYHGQAEVLNLVLEVLEARPYYGRATAVVATHADGPDLTQEHARVTSY